MFLSVVTSTYNRAYRLPITYESLCSQTDRDFEWIVVDDGSTDGTKELVQSWIDEGLLNIRYYYKENGGMHTAMNRGISTAKGLFTLKLDSDDWLADNAVEKVRHHANSKLWDNNKDKLCGIAFLNFDKDGKIIGDRFTQDLFVSNYVSERVNNSIKGDKKEVCLTELLKKTPYMEFPGERRMPSGSIWMTLAKNYDMLYVNEAIYYADYLDDGISKNMSSVGKHPLGLMYSANLFLGDKRVKLGIRIKKAASYVTNALSINTPPRKLIRESNAPFLVSIIYVLVVVKRKVGA